MKTLHILAVALIAMIAASCTGKPDVEYLPAKADGDSRWGLVNAEGEFLFTDEFEYRPSMVVNGIFYVKEGDGYTVYKAEKTPKEIGDLTGLADCGYYNNGLMPVVHKGEHISFVDKNGKEQFVLDRVDGVNVEKVFSMFVNERNTFCTAEGKWGAIDIHGKVIVPPLFDNALVFIDNRVVAKDAATGNIVIIDRDGNIKEHVNGLPEHSDLGGVFIDGYATAYGDERFFMIKKNGEVIKLPESVEDIICWKDDYIVYANEDYDLGIMKIDGDIVARPKYSNIEIMSDGRFWACRDDKFYIINNDGNTERIDYGIYPVTRLGYLMGKIFNFDFELLRKGDYIYHMCNFAGENLGKELDDVDGDINLGYVYSDFYDYAAVTAEFLKLFDSNGLKGYPFDSAMSTYASRSGYSKEWFRGDRSMSVSLEASTKYFFASSATIYSDNYIVHDVGGYSYYDWQYNPAAHVDAFKITLSFPDGDNYRDDLVEHFSKALRDKYGVELIDGGNIMNYMRGESGTITLEVNSLAWMDYEVVEVVDSVSCPDYPVEMVDYDMMPATDTVAVAEW